MSEPFEIIEYLVKLEKRVKHLERMHTRPWPEYECAPGDHEWDSDDDASCVKCNVDRREYKRRRPVDSIDHVEGKKL